MHLKPLDAMPLLIYNLLGLSLDPRTPAINFDGFTYIHYAAPPYSADIVITATV